MRSRLRLLLCNKECGVSVIVFLLHVPDSSVDEGIWRIRKTLADLIYSIQMYQVNLLTVFRFIVHHYSLTNWLFCFTYSVIHYTMVNGYWVLIVHSVVNYFTWHVITSWSIEIKSYTMVKIFYWTLWHKYLTINRQLFSGFRKYNRYILFK